MVKQTLSVLRFTYQYYIYSDLTNKKKFGAWSPHTFFCIIVGGFKKQKIDEKIDFSFVIQAIIIYFS